MSVNNQTSHAVLYAFIVAIGGFIFGVDAAIIGGVVPYLQQAPYSFDAVQIGSIVGAPTAAAIVSSLTIGIIADLFGRKRVLIFLALLYVISAYLSATAQSFWIIDDFWALFLARAIGGYAFGALSQAPVYIAEISPAHLRGRMVGINQLTIVTGFSAAYFSNLGIQILAQSDAAWVADMGLAAAPWRWMLGAELIPALVWFFAMFIVPESPRWLMTKGREDDARASLFKLIPLEQIDSAISEIKAQIDHAASISKSRFGEFFKPSIRYALMIGLIIAIIQQITGINTVFFYATTIFQLSGIGTDAAFIQTVLVGITNVVFTLVAMSLVDKLGRRPLMIVGLIGVCASFATVAFGFWSAKYVINPDDLLTKIEAESVCMIESADDLDACTNGKMALKNLRPTEADYAESDAFDPMVLLAPLEGQVFESDVAFKKAIADALTTEVGEKGDVIDGTSIVRANEALLLSTTMEGNPMIILVGIVGFVAAFALSLGPVMWIFLSEIFPARIRGTAISFVTVFNSATAWLVTFFFPIQVQTTGVAGVFMGYAGFAFISIILVIWLMPETKGLTLEELEAKLARGRKG